jgi:ketosteroid isomerase-like protein
MNSVGRCLRSPRSETVTLRDVTIPVWSLADFFDTYLALLEDGDAEGLGALYAEDAVMSTTGAAGDSWAVGRDQIVAGLRQSLATARVVGETPPTTPYEMRGDDLAARFGTFESTVTIIATNRTVTLHVESVELFRLSPTAGWQYLADQTKILPLTTPSHGS